MNNSPPEAILTTITPKSSKIMKSQTALLLYRGMIFYRFSLALVGGYILAMLSAMVIAELFREDRGSAAMSATLVAFTLWSCAFIWVFMVNKTRKATLGILIPALCLYFILKMMGP